jgi:hypothetical protein
LIWSWTGTGVAIPEEKKKLRRSRRQYDYRRYNRGALMLFDAGDNVFGAWKEPELPKSFPAASFRALISSGR